MSLTYIHTLSYSATFDSETYTLSVFHADYGRMACLHLDAVIPEGAEVIPAEALCYREAVHRYHLSSHLEVSLQHESGAIHLQILPEQVGLSLSATDEGGAAVALVLSGTVGTAKDPASDAFATAIGRCGIGLRAALGPATSYGDNAILDRQSGAAVVIADRRGGDAPRGLSLGFDFAENAYTLSFTGKSLYLSVKDNVFSDLYGIRYTPINKQATFPTPPAGWMTWYAVKFDACEQVVLENAEIMKSKLYDYGANTVWVDWEWQHETHFNEPPYGVDVFHPLPDRYPNGLAYLADRLSGMGLISALWVGFTHEPGQTAFIKAHPETVLSDQTYWYGKYTFDPSHPTWRQEYLIPAAKQLPAMGYRALKWDCLPLCLTVGDLCFDRMYGTQGPWRALHEAVEIVRDVVGKDFYMMSCSGATDRPVLFAADVFDGARIGEDVFTRDAFERTADRLCHLYPLHNTVLYCDPDNVVVRDEFNATADEKCARIALVSLLGLPITIGDDLRTLPEEDLDYYRFALPTVDAHPCDLRDYRMEDKLLTVRLSVAKPFTAFSTVGIFNFADEERTLTLTTHEELGLIGEGFHVYDVFRKEYGGIAHGTLTVTIPPHGCRVLRLTPTAAIPTVIATSRHITGGAPDLLALDYSDGRLTGKSAVIAGCAYTVTVATPDGKLHTHTLHPERTEEVTWCIEV